VMAIDAAVANANVEPSREFLERQAFEAFKAFVLAFQRLVEAPGAVVPAADESKEVMTADEVAEFLGVDRTTVYDFAARGVIPHQRLGKRLLFRRGGIVAWLDESLCRST